MNNEELEKLVIKCEYNPLIIGIKLLESLNYKVDTFLYSDGIFVYDKENKEKLLYWK